MERRCVAFCIQNESSDRLTLEVSFAPKETQANLILLTGFRADSQFCRRRRPRRFLAPPPLPLPPSAAASEESRAQAPVISADTSKQSFKGVLCKHRAPRRAAQSRREKLADGEHEGREKEAARAHSGKTRLICFYTLLSARSGEWHCAAVPAAAPG